MLGFKNYFHTKIDWPNYKRTVQPWSSKAKECTPAKKCKQIENLTFNIIFHVKKLALKCIMN